MSSASLTARELEETASAHAREAVSLDRAGEHKKAASRYKRAINSLTRLVRLYPEYKLNGHYIEKARAYQERVVIITSLGRAGKLSKTRRHGPRKARKGRQLEARVDRNPKTGREPIEQTIGAGDDAVTRLLKEFDFYMPLLFSEGMSSSRMATKR